jgi:GT2 family glycosyltransferase
LSKTRITAIMPHYNYGQFFPEAFDSLLNQSLKPDIICITDDRSTDGSYDLVYDYISEKTKNKLVKATMGNEEDRWEIKNEFFIDKIKVILLMAKKNGGRSAACNMCIQETLSETDIYAILDCDDIYHKDKIKKSIDAFSSNPNVAVVYSDLVVWNMAKHEKKIDHYRSFDYQLLCRRNCCNNNSLVIAEAFRQAGPYDEELIVAEDYDMWLRIAEFGCFYHIPEALFTYRISGLNESITTKQEVWQKCLTRLHTKRAERMRNR